jgi:hypothetical protein
MRRVLLVLLVVCALFIMVAPALANSSGWSFTMDRRYVNGDDNGAYHTMTAGNMTNNGYVYLYYILGGSVPPPFDTHIEVWRKVSGPDVYCGSSTVNTGSTLNVKKYFTTYCGTQPAGTYYLIIWKTEWDGFYTKGSGTLKTQ